MDRFREAPASNTARKVTQMLAEGPTSTIRGRIWEDFVPFAQERDHLGRLLSRQRGQSRSRDPSSRSLHTLPRSVVDPAIDRAFRLTRLPTQEGKTSERRKLRIRSSSCKQTGTPAVGSYDAASIADKVKYRKAREVAFSATMQATRKMPTESTITSQKVVRYHEVATQSGKDNKRAPLDLNLPELEKYLQMRKLKVPLNENFEESHLKFKELARKGLLLANSLRNSRQFD